MLFHSHKPQETRAKPLSTILLSFSLSLILLSIKFIAWAFTGSTAVLSDALESIVNVGAAGFALFSVWLAHKPADQSHPYGHGKIEFLSAGFEGALIFSAACLIIYEASQRILHPLPLDHIFSGGLLVLLASIVNLVLGLYLIKVGKAHHSLTLIADGQHLLTDVWTSGGVIIALLLVKFTGFALWDPLIAIFTALHILFIGYQLLKRAFAGIMDKADPEDLTLLAKLLNTYQATEPLLLGWDRLRIRHQGQLHHVDLNIYLPPQITLESAHALSERLEILIKQHLNPVEVMCHLTPRDLNLAD